MDELPELIFVYNARSGTTNKAWDFLYKIVSPDTYDCNLCKVTYGWASEKKEWKEFRKSRGINMTFSYADVFEQAYPLKYEYPVILIGNDRLSILMDRDQINTVHSVSELIEKIDIAIKKHLDKHSKD